MPHPELSYDANLFETLENYLNHSVLKTKALQDNPCYDRLVSAIPDYLRETTNTFVESNHFSSAHITEKI